jgi:hypothetical protein
MDTCLYTLVENSVQKDRRTSESVQDRQNRPVSLHGIQRTDCLMAEIRQGICYEFDGRSPRVLTSSVFGPKDFRVQLSGLCRRCLKD